MLIVGTLPLNNPLEGAGEPLSRIRVEGLADKFWVSAPSMLSGPGWIAAWEGWPYSKQGLEASVTQLLNGSDSDLAGEFNLVILDRRTGRLLVLRNGAGSYSLYFNRTDQGFAVASRVTLLEDMLGRRLPLLSGRIRAAFRSGIPTPPQSLFSGAELVPPDHIVTIEADGSQSLRANRFWIDRLRRRFDDGAGCEEARAACREALVCSVRHAADRVAPVFLLSGGLDSNLLMHAAASQGPESVPDAVTIRFPGLQCDESAETRFSCRRIGSHLEELAFLPHVFRGSSERVFGRCDLIPHVTTHFVTEAARHASARGFTGLISGLGGDEVFGIGKDHALALGVRLAPGRMLGFAHRSPRLFLRGLARRAIDGSQEPVRTLLQQSNAMFYMAAAQEAEAEGVSLRSPLRDAAVVTEVLPAVCWQLLRTGRVREFQRQLLEEISPGLTERIGRRKAIFDEVLPTPRPPPKEWGQPKNRTLGAVVSAFYEAHCAPRQAVNRD